MVTRYSTENNREDDLYEELERLEDSGLWDIYYAACDTMYKDGFEL